MRTTVFDSAGNVVEVTDNRTLEHAKAARVAVMKSICESLILQNYPEYKQRNAALGVYSQAECDAIRAGIQALRDNCHQREQEIAAATDNQQVDAVEW